MASMMRRRSVGGRPRWDGLGSIGLRKSHWASVRLESYIAFFTLQRKLRLKMKRFAPSGMSTLHYTSLNALDFDRAHCIFTHRKIDRARGASPSEAMSTMKICLMKFLLLPALIAAL